MESKETYITVSKEIDTFCTLRIKINTLSYDNKNYYYKIYLEQFYGPNEQSKKLKLYQRNEYTEIVFKNSVSTQLVEKLLLPEIELNSIIGNLKPKQYKLKILTALTLFGE
jgi:hypothetical protein